MDKAYPTYQYSVFRKGGKDEQLVIRAETFDGLIEAKENIDIILGKDTPAQPEPQNTPSTPIPQITVPSCPKCGLAMTKRTAKSTGNEFWGCSSYPECDGVIWPKK